MKTIHKAALAIVAFGIAANLNAQSSNKDTPGEQVGRYKLIPIDNGTYTTPYVIDSQTGRIWRQVVNQEHHTVVFVSCTYMSMDGAFSTVPNENATGFTYATSAIQTSNDLQVSIKEKSFWQKQLTNCVLGKPVQTVTGWDTNGNPVLGPEIPSSDKVADLIKENIDLCDKAIKQQTLFIKQTGDKAP